MIGEGGASLTMVFCGDRHVDMLLLVAVAIVPGQTSRAAPREWYSLGEEPARKGLLPQGSLVWTLRGNVLLGSEWMDGWTTSCTSARHTSIETC